MSTETTTDAPEDRLRWLIETLPDTAETTVPVADIRAVLDELRENVGVMNALRRQRDTAERRGRAAIRICQERYQYGQGVHERLVDADQIISTLGGEIR